LEERGLSGAVEADDRDAIAPQHLCGQIAIDRFLAVRLGQVLEPGDLAPAARRLGKAEADGGALLADLHDLFLLQQLDAALHLTRLRRLGAEALDEGLHLRPPARLLLRLRREALLLRRAQLEVALVVAGITAQALGLEGEDAVDLAVEEFAVVRNEEQRLARPAQEGVEPLQGGNVEVVGGLVEKEQFRILQEEPRKRGPHLPAAGERGRGAVERGLRKAETTEDLLGVVVPVELLVAGQLLVQLGELATELDLIFLGRRLRERGLGGRQPRLQPCASGNAGEHSLDDGTRRQFRQLLRQVSRARLADELHGAGIRFHASGDDLHQRALAAAVGADEADAIAVAERKAGAVQQHLGAIPQREPAGVQQGHAQVRPPRTRAFTPSPSRPASGSAARRIRRNRWPARSRARACRPGPEWFPRSRAPPPWRARARSLPRACSTSRCAASRARAR